MQRREFLKLTASSLSAACLTSCGGESSRAARRRGRVLVLAFDGLDPRIVSDLMQRGRLPNFAKVAQVGSFKRLATTTPPHTPVAFSSIISGVDPGTHSIFDFIHRDPNPASANLVVRPYFSTSDVGLPETSRFLPLGRWRLPLTAVQPRLLRRGPAFWESLIRHGIDTSVYYVPANYPPQPVEGSGQFRCISGMGTPDLLGGYGEFTLLSPDVSPEGRPADGGQFVHLAMREHRAEALLVGPPNFLQKPRPDGSVEPMVVSLRIRRDPQNPVAMIEISGRKVLLNEGEWSDWQEVVFRTGIPGSTVLNAAGAPTSVAGIVRFLLKQVHPKLVLYVSPINLDPQSPASRISVPHDFARELARHHGRFYTLGIPEDTDALNEGALTEDEFIAQVDQVIQEHLTHYTEALQQFKAGCLFFYFGWPDLMQHMFWRDRDPDHPGRDPRQGDRYAHVVEDVYERLDPIVAQGWEALSADETLIILSDHGFTTFRRGFNLNSWLLRNGFLAIHRTSESNGDGPFGNLNWSATTAYGLGMNGLYLNLLGREKAGRVRENQRRSMLEQLRDQLMTVRDYDGSAVIERVDLVEDLYPAADRRLAPDLIIGYADKYRASWATVLGSTPPNLIENNLDRWSGTHLISPNRVPGILISNRTIAAENPSLVDLAPSILDLFQVPLPATMMGRSVFS